MLTTALELLAGHRIVALTGAGISTDSGIPDYRSPNAPPRTPMTFQQFIGSDLFRRHYWARNFLGYQFMTVRHPNPGHVALSQLQASGGLTGIITQNIDTLHQKAGSRNVIDLHGRFDQVLCLTCEQKFTRAYVQELLAGANPEFNVTVEDVEIAPDADAILEDTAHFLVPPCPICGGILKPNVVYFGETVPKNRADAAAHLTENATALLVAGSSLNVHSGLRFVLAASRAKKPIVIINRGLTRGDQYADVKLDADLSSTLTELAAKMTGNQSSTT